MKKKYCKPAIVSESMSMQVFLEGVCTTRCVGTIGPANKASCCCPATATVQNYNMPTCTNSGRACYPC